MDIDVARRAYLQARRLGASDKVMLALFEAGLVESNFENLNYGDRDSVGFLQQRPSAGWGTVAQCMNVEYATTSFVTRAQRIQSRYTNAGALAQAVQVSAYPARYDLRKADALALIARVEGEDDLPTPEEVWRGYQLPAPQPFADTAQKQWMAETFLRKIAEGATPQGKRIAAIESRMNGLDAKLDQILARTGREG